MKLRLILAFVIGLMLTNITNAQYFPFGKNRVQYDEFEWRVIKSKHFDIYYYSEQNYKLAEFAAMSIESAYKQISEDFDHEISDRISLIVYDSHNDFSQTNVVALPTSAEGIGGVTDKLKNRMTVPFLGDYNDFRRTLHHELVHAVINDMFYGGTLQSIMQNNIQLMFPLWFEEGLAEYSALGWDTNTDMFIRDAVINNYLPPIPYLSGYYAYRGGQSLWNYIVEEYGREKIGEILQRIKTSRSVEYGLSASLGYNIQELSDKWEEALKKRYYPEVAERENSKNIATLLTKRGVFGTYNTSPAISPQGDKVALITNKRGYFDVVVISTIDGRKLKTLIKGEDNPEFEELNILKPNLTWSPDGRRVALSTKSKGSHDIAFIEYETGEIKKLKLPELDAIGSVDWSPDGKYIAFDGNVGPFQDIFIYEIETGTLTDITQDIFSDREPSWASDSKSIYFVSDRGGKTDLGVYGVKENLLVEESLYQTDIYQVELNSKKAIRLTNTPGWNETQPSATRDGRIVFISDENGIQNIYELDHATRTSTPLTDLQSGVSQLSISADGSRIAFASINEGYLDVFLLKSPFNRKKTTALTPNYWAKRRAAETEGQRVPATTYARQMFGGGLKSVAEIEKLQKEEEAIGQDTSKVESDVIDFRNYVFAEEVIKDSTLVLKDIVTFDVRDNITEDGRYIPEPYRLKFDLDIAYSPTLVASTYGSSAIAQFLVSDLLGDHQMAFGTNFVFDLRDSDYSVQYGNFKHRTNYFVSYFHTSRNYQTYYGELIRYRTYGAGLSLQYPIDKFKRVDFNLSMMGVALDYNRVYGLFSSNQPLNAGSDPSEKSRFLNPEIVYTNDRSKPGFITPSGGSRFAIGLSGSPVISPESPEFISLLGDFRKYVGLGRNYSIALRFSGGISFGKDAQNYFMGGKLGWINQRWADNGMSLERLADSFFTVPALPLRGYRYNSITGSNFSLINAEFRFPLFAAVIPGAVPILPLYNMTGLAFLDVGTAWGQEINYGLLDENGNPIVKGARLDFTVGKERIGYAPLLSGSYIEVPYIDGDILIGGGFGLRTILLGLPFGYDIGWAFDRTGFKPKATHYFTIGIDF